MEKFMYEGENQKMIEHFLTAIFTLYTFFIISISVNKGQGNLIPIVLLILLAINWIICVSKCKTYLFRARFSAVVMQISMVIYATQIECSCDAFPIIAAFIVFSGLYGNAQIIYITVASTTFIMLYNGLIVRAIDINSTADVIQKIMQIANIYLLEYVVYIWTQRNSDGSRYLLDMIDELREVESSKDDFLANVSHEIRTPINTICGISEILMQEELSDDIKEDVANIQQAGKNITSVVSDILDFSELQSGKMELEEEAYNITSTINDIINMTLAKKEDKNLEILVDCDPNIPCALLGDVKKFRRIVMNILDNAIKFTEKGGVTIIIGFRKESYGINLSVTVKDTGIGMRAESMEKMFARFSQGDASRRRQEGGVGLGLAISYALIKKMGGAITVKSEVNKGTIVKFTIPQQVLDEKPITRLDDRGEVNVAVYMNMEKFEVPEIRDDYTHIIRNMAQQLHGKCQMCRDFAELQRREKKTKFSHVFISNVEYQAHPAYFDELAERTNVVAVLDRVNEKDVPNSDIYIIYKPFYILSIASVLNGKLAEKRLLGVDNGSKFAVWDAHILVVDDNKMNLRVVEGILQDYKIKVTSAISGAEGLEKITSADYDFVFMDIMMPEMDGIETMHRIRHMVGTYFQKVPIVALTANAVAGARETLITEGFDDFLEKPVERSVLERVLRRNISREKIISKEEYNQRMEQIRKENGEEVQQDKIGKETKKETQKESQKEVQKNPVVESVVLKEVEETEVFVDELETKLKKIGLDVEKGILYCGGKEQYINILQDYCTEFTDSGATAQELFEKQDWKNYTITVHGIKSSMGSIGATEISEQAKQLEFAGKENRIDYILENHSLMMKDYKEFFAILCETMGLERKEIPETDVSENVDDLPVLAEDVFNALLNEMEDAMYDLDGDKLLEDILELEKYQYHGKALESLLIPVRRKIEKSDYMSAVDMVTQIKEELADKE